MTPSAATGGEPLARLFAIAFRQLIDGLHERLASQGWTDVRPSFGFVLLAARDEPTTATALAALLGTTKQAASKLVDTMEAAGYVARSVDDGDARQRPIRLTTRGRDLLTAVEAIYDDLEAEWADAIGRRRVAAIRRDLTEVLSDPAGVLPAVRPGW